MKEKIRVVSATVHQKNNEVEVIIEKTINVDSLEHERDTLHSIWIDCEHELAKLEEAS